MHGKNLHRCVTAAALLLSSLGAAAIDDHFDASKYEKGGFAPVADPAYAKECGSCHFTYLPGMLPARSWRQLLTRADHFGESLSLAPDDVHGLEAYLAANAADRSAYLGSKLMLNNVADDQTPLRITQLPLMRLRHIVIRKLISDNAIPVKTLTNCDACHVDAASGDFAFKKIEVPGITSRATTIR